MSGVVIPQNFNIAAYPNPFNPSTRITYTLPAKANVEIKIFDMLGREVIKLVDKVVEAGTKEVEWDATNYPSGLYFYKLQTALYVDTKKM